MDWILIISMLSMPGQPALAVGHIVDESSCRVAGAGFVILLQQANPGLVAGFKCVHRGVAS